MLTIQDVHPDHTQTPSPLDPSWIVIRLCKAYAQTTPRPRALWSYKPCSQTIPHTPSLMEPDEVIPHIARIALLGLAQELRAGAHYFTSIKCFVILQCRVVVLLQTVKSICLIPTQRIAPRRLHTEESPSSYYAIQHEWPCSQVKWPCSQVKWPRS